MTRVRSLLALLLLAGCGRGAEVPPSEVSAAGVADDGAERPAHVARMQSRGPADAATADRNGPSRSPVVTLIPSDDETITRGLTDGIRLAFDESRAAGGPDLALHVAARATSWGSLAESAVREVIDADAVAFVAPPERRHAHLLAQLATRAKVPMLSTSPWRSVTAAGSTWVAAVVPTGDPGRDAAPLPPAFDAAAAASHEFVEAFRAAAHRDPGPWDAVGYEAGRRAVAAVLRNGLHRDGFLVQASATAVARAAR